MKPEFLKGFYRFYSNRANLVDLLLKMPKDTTEHVIRNQTQRMKIKEKSKFYSPGTVNIQVLGNGARGGSTSVYLFSEQARYLFNCGEGTQRLAHEHRTKLTRMEHIFLTRKSWCRFGGVPGLCLTLQEIGVPALNLHGPSGIDETFAATKKFVVLRNLKVETPECLEGGSYEDSVLKVSYVPLFKSRPESLPNGSSTDKSEENVKPEDSDASNDKTFNDDTDYYGYENNNNKKSRNSPTQPEFKSKQHLEDHVMAYICKLRERTGTLDLQKCVEKGVKPGPLLGRLKNGFDVSLHDGTVVKADDVRGPASPGSVFIFIDIPDESYLTALMKSESFKPYQKGAEREDNVALIVVHFCSEEMMENVEYKNWIDDFSASTKHWFVNERNTSTGFFASHGIQHQLNHIDGDVFPLLKEPHPHLKQESHSGEDKIRDEKFLDYPELGMLSTFHVRPAKGFDRNLEIFSNPATLALQKLETPELPEMIENYKQEAAKFVNSRSKAERAKEFPKIITFGTGSCIPNKTRNVSANLVHVSDDNCLLLDCGEGTLGQIVRFYGRDESDRILKNLRMIYISHLHADHHLGLINILSRRRLLTNEKLMLLAPIQISAWMSFYNYRIEEIKSTFDLFQCSDLVRWNIEENQKNEFCQRVGLKNVETCYVKHCPHAYGISFEMKNLTKSPQNPKETVKITYSGDTLPCDELVGIGMDSDVLIHEATMEDDLVKEAKIKMHSTVSQAIDIGKRMNSKFVILTHFSQRYAKIPLIRDHKENVAIGFDNMEVTLNDLPKMHLMYEPLKVMFSDHLELMELKTMKRKRQEEKRIGIIQADVNQKNKITKLADSD